MRSNGFLPILFLGVWAGLGLLFHPTTSVYADMDPDPDDPERSTRLTIQTIYHDWWLLSWEDNEVECKITVAHEYLPDGDDIYNACGKTLYKQWAETKPCLLDDIESCPGLYLHEAEQYINEQQIKVDLPKPEAWLDMGNCSPQEPENWCTESPTLSIIGIEPLPNEIIIRVHGYLDGVYFSCPGGSCVLPMRPTGTQGQILEFWADSSFGDSSPVYNAQIRVIPHGDFSDPENGQQTGGERWQVDILSSQWRGTKPSLAAEIWEVFPDVGGIPGWLTTPTYPEALESSISYYYLAGMLIRNGVVNADACPRGGLSDAITANACGVQAALPEVITWQNQFNEAILSAAQKTGVPAQLMKNIFSRESQFWPGIYRNYSEAGLGQLTENGADTILLWNVNFYQQFCPLMLEQRVCGQGFAQLNAYEQSLLKGALVQKVNADCPECLYGINLSQVDFSVEVFAEGLIANARQVSRTIYNATKKTARDMCTYEDLWRFTLVNYNAGSGCLEFAIETTHRYREDLTWENVAARLAEPNCSQAIGYVESISQPFEMEIFELPQPAFEADADIVAEEESFFSATPTPGP
jgi:hypothetical protein